MSLPMPFQRGQLVVAVLREPRERLWGRLLGLDAAGLAMRGLELTPWEENLSLIRQGQGELVAVGTRFVPMHRLESFYLDEPSSGLESLAAVFQRRTGTDPLEFLADR